MSPSTRAEGVDTHEGVAPHDGVSPQPTATSALRERYRVYRLRQGRNLLGLIPRAGLRQMVRACRSATARPPGTDVSLDELAAFCADRMPLPPLAVWMSDFQLHREAHLAEEARVERGPRSPDGGPVAVAVRHFAYEGAAWVGQLQVWPRDDRWEGAIQFHRDDENRSWRTAAIFREESVSSIRERFRIFDDPTLSAFLRSSLP